MLNKTMIIGRIGKAPVKKTFADDNEAVTVRVAVNEAKKNSDGEWENKATWYTVKATGKYNVEKAEKLTKGMLVFVEGKATAYKFKDDEGEVSVGLGLSVGMNGRITVLDSGKTGEKEEKKSTSEMIDDDIPF